MIDLDDLHDRMCAAVPQLTCEMVELEHSETRDCHRALLIQTDQRKFDHVYRMTIAVIGDRVSFFVHVHGTSKDLTTQGAEHFTKTCASTDEVFAIVHSCWTESLAS